MPTGPDQGNKNRITRRITADIRSKCGDSARRFVAVNRRQSAAPGPLGIGNVGMADRAGGDFYLDLALSGRAQVDLLDNQGLSEFVAYRSLHITLLFWVNDPMLANSYQKRHRKIRCGIDRDGRKEQIPCPV